MPEPDRLGTKNDEYAKLAEAAKDAPELFATRSFVEDQACLQEFGITIAKKETFPRGYLKLWPQDFIVEEIGPDGTVYTVNTPANAPSNEEVRGSTTFATLVKCGISTLEAVEDIAGQLGCGLKDIGTAGIKDKDALTAQRISFRKISPQRVAQVSSPYFFLKDLAAGKGVVETAGLKGNRFTILIRTEESFFRPDSLEALAARIQKVQENGFANFFYLQRFGTPRLTNYRWGLWILQGKYQEAVHDIIAFQAERELPYFKNLRRECEAVLPDWEQVETLFAPFPIIFRHELKLVRHLKANPNDYAGALRTIEDQVLLWVYALASRYFNERISRATLSRSPLPPKLPLFLSPDPKDWVPYATELRRDGIFPPPFHHLRPFASIRMRHRELPTSDRANILKVEATDQGLVLSFTLSKGQYATTFLSHFFNLVSGALPEGMGTEPGDLREALGDSPLTETLEYFSSVITEKKTGPAESA